VSGLGIPGRTAVACSAAAVIAFLTLALFGQPKAGAFLAVGLALGGLNGLLATGAADALGSFRVGSLVRLGFLSVVALAIGLLFQPALAWIIVAGLASSQFVMSAIAIHSGMRS
jgi:hypothetical protein